MFDHRIVNMLITPPHTHTHKVFLYPFGVSPSQASLPAPPRAGLQATTDVLQLSPFVLVLHTDEIIQDVPSSVFLHSA